MEYFRLGTQKSNFSLFGGLPQYCFTKQNEKEQSSLIKALSTKDLTCIKPRTNPPLCQSLASYKDTDFTARIDWWTLDVHSIPNCGMILRPYVGFI